MLAFSAKACCWRRRAASRRETAVDVLTHSVIGSPMVQYRGPFVLKMPDEVWFDVNMMQKDMMWRWRWADGSRPLADDAPSPTSSSRRPAAWAWPSRISRCSSRCWHRCRESRVNCIARQDHLRILIIGATGTIGKAVAAALGARHDLVLASHQKAAEQVDIANPASIQDLFSRVGRVDAVVSAAPRRVQAAQRPGRRRLRAEPPQQADGAGQPGSHRPRIRLGQRIGYAYRRLPVPEPDGRVGRRQPRQLGSRGVRPRGCARSAPAFASTSSARPELPRRSRRWAADGRRRAGGDGGSAVRAKRRRQGDRAGFDPRS